MFETPVTDTFMLPCDLICGHKRVDMIIIQTSNAQIQVDVCALVKGIPVVSNGKDNGKDVRSQ